MEKRLTIPNFLIPAGLFILTVLLHGFSRQLEHASYLNPPPENLEHFAFGFRDSIADSLWLRWIQDNDTCQTYKMVQAAPAIPLQEGMTRFTSPRHKICDNSWSFKMLDATTKLAPRFMMPYEAGAITLSVMVEDYEGAKVMFDRGIEVYPHDWNILYRAAYHYLFDRQDFSRAAELLTRAGEEGAPSWVRMLAARLYAKSGQRDLAVSVLEAYKKTLQDEKAVKTVQKRIDEFNKQAD
jgi:hypothetical protein